MRLGNLLDQIRTHYLDRFRDAISECEADPEFQTIIESAFHDAAGHIVREGVLNLPMRGDIFVVSGDEAINSLRIDTENMLRFSPLSFTWERHLAVRLKPFRWNWCPLELSPARSAEELSPVVGWFNRWFEGAEGTGEQFSGVVHFLSDPVVSNDSINLQVDLGSAPAEAFEELLDACLSAGAISVTIGS